MCAELSLNCLGMLAIELVSIESNMLGQELLGTLTSPHVCP